MSTRPVSPLHPYADRFAEHDHMPTAGVPRETILDELRQMASEEDAKGDSGRVSGSIYCGDHDHYAFLAQAFALFGHVNVLQRDMYPSSTKMEAEIIAMTADMLHAGVAHGNDADDVGGLVTSGGTESLVSAMLAYREWGRHTRDIARPNIIMPVTAHPAIDKGCYYFGIDVIKAPVDGNQQVDVDFVRDHIDLQTVAIVGSAGTYPHGVVDPIQALGELALERGIGLHVDGCLGGFILPWADSLGFPVEPFDFRVPGVTSMSADTHKYGYGFKGSSVLLFRHKSLRRHQYFITQGWPGGAYSSPGMSGSRSGGIIASTWASLLSLGRQGYQRYALDIFTAAEAVKSVVRQHPQLALLGDSRFNIAFGAAAGSGIDIFHVNDSLAAAGWRLNGLQNPAGLHFCITRPNTQPGVVEAFGHDVADAVAYAQDPPAPRPKSGAMYGAGGVTPDPDRIAAGLASFMDAIHEVRPVVRT
jgi:sphinganine-1-phosphate aldolase